MKMNKSKIIVSTLALAMGAALAGSVSGTVAWFQYSTRAQAAYIGESVHCSEMLEVQATAVNGTVNESNWKGELLANDVATAIGESSGTKLSPITSGVMAADGALPTDMYANPIYQHFAYNTWEKATVANYAQFELHFRVRDVNGENTAKLLAKDVYLTNLSIVSLKDKSGGGYEEDTAATSDLYKAIRVHISSSSKNALFASTGATAASGVANVETLVGANLDLNNDGEFDTTAAYSDWQTGDVTAYGGATTDKQIAYNVSNKDVYADDLADPTFATASAVKGSIGSLGTTVKTGTEFKVTVTIWIEGWQGLSKQATATGTDNAEDAQVWDPATYIGKKFGVGMRFAVPTHTAADDE